MVTPAKFDLDLYQGAGFSKTFTYRAAGSPVNLTGYTITAQLRTSADATAATVAFTVTVDTPADGVFVLSLTGAQTAAIAAGRYVYDIKLVPPGNEPDVLLYGDCRVRARVTR